MRFVVPLFEPWMELGPDELDADKLDNEEEPIVLEFPNPEDNESVKWLYDGVVGFNVANGDGPSSSS